jgi:hypothetical protein
VILTLAKWISETGDRAGWNHSIPGLLGKVDASSYTRTSVIVTLDILDYLYHCHPSIERERLPGLQHPVQLRANCGRR